MKAGDLYTKTMPFVWAKLLLGVITVAISAVLFAILMGLALLFNDGSIGVILFIVWLSATGIVRFVIMHYLGYLVKAGHIAVMAEALTTGRVPDNQVAYGKQMVTERFATANIYFAVDKLVSGAVKQIQRGIGKVGDLLGFIPGMKQVTSLAQFFVELSLGYIDECCLGYTFYRKDQGACKSAADGVVIYAQNWKTLLASAAKTMLLVILGIAGITLALFIVLGLLFRLFNGSGLVAFGLSLLIALVIKNAFMDSFILARTMTAYMAVAPTTQISFDLYGKLCGLSGKFKQLFNKGQNEAAPSAPAYASPAPVGNGPAPVGYAPAAPEIAAADDRPVFCGSCGGKNTRGTKFCGSCGAKMQ